MNPVSGGASGTIAGTSVRTDDPAAVEWLRDPAGSERKMTDP